MIGRERELMAISIAIMAKEHCLLVGPPGTAKSLLVEKVCAASKLRYWRFLCHKFMTPDDLMGPISMQGLRDDSYRRNLHGIATCDIAFLDEVFKASAAGLNTLLSVMEERQVFNPNATNIPLLSILAASNELPQGDDAYLLGALADRLMVKVIVEPLPANLWKQLLMYSSDLDNIPVVKPIDNWNDVQFNEQLLDDLVSLREECEKQAIIISDRRFRKSLKIIHAHAVYHGREYATKKDLMVLRHCWWNTIEESRKLATFLPVWVNPTGAEIEKLMDEATNILLACKSSQKAGKERFAEMGEALDKTMGICERLAQLDAPDELAKCQSYQKEIARLVRTGSHT